MPQLGFLFAVLLLVGCFNVWLLVARRLAERRAVIEYQPRSHVPWTGIDVLVLTLAWPVVELVALRIAGVTPPRESEEVTAAALVAVAVGHSLWTVAALGYLAVRSGRNFGALGFDTRRLATDVRLGFLAFLAASVPVYATQAIVSLVVDQQSHSAHPLVKLLGAHPAPGLIALAVVTAVVVAPVSEELLFRVILQGWLEKSLLVLRKRAGRAAASLVRGLPILGSSTLFMLLHQPFNWPALFLLALFLGYLYRRTHRIVPSITLHASINALALLGLLLGAR
jgi:uncharacterized protein